MSEGLHETRLPAPVAFELTDDVADDAARQMWRAQAGPLLQGRSIAVMLLVAGILWMSWGDELSTLWRVLLVAPLALYGVFLLVWSFGYLLAPKRYRARLAHLPHRRCSVEFEASTIAFASATERLTLDWSELHGIDALPDYWQFRLPNEVRIAVPRRLLTEQAVAALVRHSAWARDRGGAGGARTR